MLVNALTFVTLAAVAAMASPQGGPNESCPKIICIDAINVCGIRYGGCYDTCTQPKPAPPPCPATTTTTMTTSSTSAPAACTSGTICVDKLKTCGDPTTATLTYGGCYDLCGPTPTWTTPSCPTPTPTGV
ncbi:hypothetical protein F4778DRAFT_780203 [Xylariomycetidae sp. FL2044]|nr:hypothetical protein F4778DRAFT_780203 [Xylariomycetidae sp. FL2044]